MKTSRIVATGFAMFAMLFGAGNVVYPLALGRDIGHQLWFGLLGFVLTAVIVPLVGLVSTMLADGDYKKFFSTLGAVPAQILILVCLSLIGPFAIVPRCIAISHAALKPYVSWLTLPIFSVIAGLIIFSCTIRRSAVVDLLGKFLGPLKFGLLFLIIIVGLLNPSSFVQVGYSSMDALKMGLESGYGTVDLLGTIFFSGLILSGLKRDAEPGEEMTLVQLAKVGLKAGIIGGFLLGFVYTGFCMVSAYWGAQLVGVPDADIFAVLSRLVLGEAGGFLANVTVAVACLTTAIALTVVFASYLHKEILKEKYAYHYALIATVLTTIFMSNLGFSGIMKLIIPVIFMIYPAMIVLAIMHIVDKLWGVRCIKIPVVLTFLVCLGLKLMS